MVLFQVIGARKLMNMIKQNNVVCFLVLLIFSSCGTTKLSHQNTPNEISIFLCIGQSNMAGRAEIEPNDTIASENIFLFNDQSKWEIARNPLNRHSTIRKNLSMQKLSPAWTFSKKMSEVLENKKIGLVVNARGGSSIYEWQKGGKYYKDILVRAKAAQKTGIVKGIIWHQGESDSNKAENYTSKFVALVESFRKDLGVSNLPVVVGEIGRWKKSSETINRVISELKNHIKYVDYVKTNELTSIGDDSHFNAESQRILGERYAMKMIELLNSFVLSH